MCTVWRSEGNLEESVVLVHVVSNSGYIIYTYSAGQASLKLVVIFLPQPAMNSRLEYCFDKHPAMLI